MAAKRKAGEVAGFDVVRAMKKARDGQGSAPPPPKKPNAPPAATPDQPDDQNKGTRAKVGRTAVPTKHLYVCYECGYEFTVAGKAHSLYCAKCRTILNQTDYTISKRHDVPIQTAGVVTIEPEGIWKGKTLSARDVILKGRHESGTIKAFRKLEVYPGAVVQLDEVETSLLIIQEGTELTLTSPLTMKNVEVFGVIDGDLETTGRTTIRPGGHVKGRLKTKHLTIDEGGGLTADVVIGVEKKEEPPANKLTATKTAADAGPVKKTVAKESEVKKPPAKAKPKAPTKKAGESDDSPA